MNIFGASSSPNGSLRSARSLSKIGETTHLTVLSLDKDFELIAEITGLSVERLQI